MGNHSVVKKEVLGDEYDKNLRAQLLATLREFGALPTVSWRGIGGSQELERLDVTVDGETIEVESETYIGLTVRGAASIVDRIVARVRERISSQST